MSDHILIEKSGGVLTLTMNRPEKKNALTRAMYQALGDAIDQAEFDKDVRCVLIQANGDMFTAGNDISDFAAVNAGDSSANEARRGGNPLLAALARAKTPLIAAVNGRAVGVGTTMLLHCDLVYLADNALLTTPFVNLALVPEAASSLLAPRLMGHQRAFALLAAGEGFSAAAARDAGLVYAVVDPAAVEDEALAAARRLAAKPPKALSIARSLIRGARADVSARIDEEASHFAAQLKSPEARAAFEAFMARGKG